MDQYQGTLLHRNYEHGSLCLNLQVKLSNSGLKKCLFPPDSVAVLTYFGHVILYVKSDMMVVNYVSYISVFDSLNLQHM